MRPITVFAFALCSILIPLSGCDSPTPGPSGADAFAGRLKAAKEINNSTTRDDALAKVAIDAADGGDGNTVKKAIGEINYSTKKDEAASKAALKLAKAGKVEDANAVAKMINYNATKDQTLSKIAKGEFGE